MKQIAKLLIVTTTLFGCDQEPANQSKGTVKLDMNTVVKVDDDSVSDTNLYVVTIDSCEYLYQPYGYNALLTHRGRCRFCEQRAKSK